MPLKMATWGTARPGSPWPPLAPREFNDGQSLSVTTSRESRVGENASSETKNRDFLRHENF
jgi:hypothetical protein